MSPKKKVDVDTNDIENPVSIDNNLDDEVVVLGELEIDFDDNVLLDKEDGELQYDPYVDNYTSSDFESSVVSLLSDYHPIYTAEKRGSIVNKAMKQALQEYEKDSCYPACLASKNNFIPVFKYNKVIVLDDPESLVDFNRQMEGIEGFDARVLKQEIDNLKESTDKNTAWRPLSGGNSELKEIVDPATRHCVLPAENCSEVSLNNGLWTRTASHTVEKVRLLPGDKVTLERIDVNDDEKDFDNFTPDVIDFIKTNNLTSTGQADRMVEDMGLLWNTDFRNDVRKQITEMVLNDEIDANDEGENDDVDVMMPDFTSNSSNIYGDVVAPKTNLESIKKKLESALTKLKIPAKKKISSKKDDNIVRIYKSLTEFMQDEGNPEVLYGEEFDSTDRSVLLKAMELDDTGKSIEEKIQDVSNKKLTKQELTSIAKGGKLIDVGDKVILSDKGTDQIYMRAKEASTGKYFWALQSTIPKGYKNMKLNCVDDKKDQDDSVCYEAPPSDEEIAVFKRDQIDRALERINESLKKFPDNTIEEARIRSFDTEVLKYTRDPVNNFEIEVSYVSPQTDEFVSEFRAVAEDISKDNNASMNYKTYAQLAAASMLGQIVRGAKLPVKDLGVEWLVELVATSSMNNADALEAELNPEQDPLRLSFLISAANASCALAVMFGNEAILSVLSRAKKADVTGLLSTAKANAVWEKASEKLINSSSVDAAGMDLKQRSPMLSHVLLLKESGNIITSAEIKRPNKSKLDDWVGFKPRLDFLKVIDETIPKSLTGTCCPQMAKTEKKDKIDIEPKIQPVTNVLKTDILELLKNSGIQDKNKDKKFVEEMLKSSNIEIINCIKNSLISLNSLIARLSHLKREDDDLRPYKSISPPMAKDILKNISPIVKSVKDAKDIESVFTVWIKIMKMIPVSLTGLLIKITVNKLKIVNTDVEKLFNKMEEAKENIKMEKIAFIEAWNEEEQSLFGEMRALGLQTINEQILEYDRLNKNQDLTPEEIARQATKENMNTQEEDSSYDTMEFYNQDDGLDYDD
ncbi:hypothetical protein TetV_205 [Tetraselmis virus 1]|uniref:Uncharacterized protein n=1 Tax=Tetraselmis virus 1 TaxID=2060617 RepID=A0A2P0VN07_9VIRU|nr:hypothetical protein QJ968_gp205 [Tetraselmis virus 1]AUF82297.1 hypothetical protein TetV_205 [Tetraselmis virus 1]